MARLPLSSLVAALCLVLAGQAQAANTQVTGKLTKRGYTLIMLGKNAKAKTFRAPGKFELKPAGNTATLHLRAPDGTYAGPVVVGTVSPSEVIVGAKGGAALGTLQIKDGYAVAGREVKEEYLAEGRTAKAKKGKPIGAGNFGRVRTGRERGTGGGQDPDRDGVPNVFDADDDGDLNLDSTDPVGRFRGVTDSGFRVRSQLLLGLGDVGMSKLTVVMDRLAGEPVELDCAKLKYCSKGGTGQVEILSGPKAGLNDFPADFDGDGDGLGNMNPASRNGAAGPEFPLLPRATKSQIGPGDTFFQRAGDAAVPSSIGFVFTTVPLLLEWSDGTSSGEVSYPASSSSLGSAANPIPVGPGVGGQVEFTVTLARPQRSAFPGEGGSIKDIGHLSYPVEVAGFGACDVATISSSDLERPSQDGSGGWIDASGDATPAPGRSLTFSVDLTLCLNAMNEEGTVGTWAPGETLELTLGSASEAGGFAGQQIFLQHK